MPSIRLDGKQGFSVKFSPFFPQYLACAASDNYGLKGAGSLLILENDGSEHLKLRKNSSWTNGLLDVTWLRSNENLLVSSSSDGSIQLWKLFGEDGILPFRTYKEHNLDVVAVDSNFNLIASGSWDSTIKIWDLNNTLSLLTVRVTQGIIHSVKWSYQFPNLLLSVSNNYHLALWDKSQPVSSVHRIEPQNSESLDCDWNQRKPYQLGVCGTDGAVRIWDIRSLRVPISIMSGHERAIARIKWSHHYPDVLGTTSYDLNTGIWDLKRGGLVERVRHHSGFILGFDFNPHEPGQAADSGLDSLIHVFTPWSLHEFNSRRIFKNKL